MSHDIVALGDVCEFLDSKRVPITASDRKPGPYPYYGANGQQDSVDDYIFDEPLVLLAEDGGYFGSKDRPIAYKVIGKCWVNNHAHVLRPKPNIDVDYLHRVLSYYDVTKYVNGTTRQKLTKGSAEDISFPLPPLTEQKRIASLLARADRLRQLRRTAHDLGDALLQSVFLEMFGDIETNKKGWEITNLIDLCAEPFTNGVTLSQDSIGHGTKLVNIVDLYESHMIDISTLGRCEVSDRQIKTSKLQKGDIIFVRSSVKREGAAMCSYFPGDVEPVVFGCFNIRFRPDLSRVNSISLTSFLRTQEGRKRLLERCQTATITNINQEGLGSIAVPVPPLSLQEEFAGVVARVERLRARMSEAERQVDGLFESLLSQSFDGGR